MKHVLIGLVFGAWAATHQQTGGQALAAFLFVGGSMFIGSILATKATSFLNKM